MTAKDLPPAEWLRARYSYDPETGDLKSRRTGRPITATNRNGYLIVHLRYNTGKVQKNARAHRVIWKICTGSDPIHQIDHIDRNRQNNRLENLRDVPAYKNQRNTARAKNHHLLPSDRPATEEERLKIKRQANREKPKQYHAEYRAANREKLKQYHAEYRAANRERLNQRERARYARKKAESQKIDNQP